MADSREEVGCEALRLQGIGIYLWGMGKASSLENIEFSELIDIIHAEYKGV